MTTKPRSPGKTAISVSIPVSLLNQLDERAAALGLNRSQYISQLAKADLMERGDLTLKESPKESSQDAPKHAGSRDLTKYPSLSKLGERGKTGA